MGTIWMRVRKARGVLWTMLALSAINAIVIVSALRYGQTASVVAAQAANSYVPNSTVHQLTAISAVTQLDTVDRALSFFQIDNNSTAATVYLKCRTTSATAITTITPFASGVITLRPGQIFDSSVAGFQLSASQKFNPKACYFTQTGAAGNDTLQLIFPASAVPMP